MTLKSFLISLFLLIIFFPKAYIKAQQIDQVDNFSSQITINTDTSISIIEEISYQTNLQKHGIFRYIPISYSRNGLNYTAKVKNINITDKKTGLPIPFTQSSDSKNITLKIGDPNTTFTGTKIYRISYEVENALKRFQDHDELYWDITGEGWQIPILTSQATIKSPFAQITKVDCFTGEFGSNDKLCQSDFNQNQAVFIYPQLITYGQNFTVAIALDQSNSSIIFPGKLETTIKTIRDNILKIGYFSLFIIMPVVFFLIWYKKGRDYMFISPNVFNNDPAQPQQLKPIFYRHRTPFVYEPLKDLTPGEAGTILDERTDNQDVIAEILDLARKKYLKIEQIEEKNFLGKSLDYKFTKLKESDDLLPAQQKYLLEKIFGNSTEKTLKSLKGKFYTHMQKTKEMINQILYDKKLFTKNPYKIRNLYIFLFIIASFIIPGLSIIMAFILGYSMPQKTAVGTNFMLQARGLKETIKRGKWREQIKEKNLFIEEVLPFAVALGVVDKLAKDMEDLNLTPPSYIHTTTYSNLATAQFLNSFSSQANSNLSYNPSSSHASGGSGFSGGSSGGGGGGGGGGSW
jgi:uncharacterized membrane protein